MFWKEVNRVRKGSSCMEDDKVKAEDGTMLVESGQWKSDGLSISSVKCRGDRGLESCFGKGKWSQCGWRVK